ncbi:MAG: hypothetical protein ACJ75J_01885 [Cytophagaceae bacterium]
MKDSFLTPVIAFLVIFLADSVEKMFSVITISEQIWQNFIAVYFIFLLILEIIFIVLMVRDIKYSRLE